MLPLGPILFAIVTAALTFIEYDFLLGLGWHPIYAPTFDWPSGLALGPYGFVMTATFIVSGVLMSLLGLRLFLDLKPGAASRTGSILLACAGLALAGLAFTADPTIRSTPATWHGRLHDISFVVLGLTLMPSMSFLGKAFRGDPRWHNFGIYTWITVALCIPAFALKSAAFYVFLFAVLLWTELIAWRVIKTA